MTTKNRLKKIEQARGTGAKKKYLCVIGGGGIFGNEDNGYKAQSCFGGDDIHFDTLAELKAFEARPDIELQIVEIVYASQAIDNGAE